MDGGALIEVLKALADEKRLKILELLLRNDLCVGALAKRLGISKPAVSQHLRVLRKAGLVRGEKRGYWTHYMVDRPTLARIATELGELATTDKTDTICPRTDIAPITQLKSKETNMCQNCCEQPDKLKERPENCSQEQIRQCHGDTKEHLCTNRNRAPESE